MKKAFRVLGIIALVAIVGFSMAACDDDSGSGGGGGSGSGSGGSGGSSGGSSSGRGITVNDKQSGTDLDFRVFKLGTEIRSGLDIGRLSLTDAFLGQGQILDVDGKNYTGVIKNALKLGAEWKGSGDFTVGVTVSEAHKSYHFYVGYIPSVRFSNGNVTVNLSSFTELPDY